MILKPKSILKCLFALAPIISCLVLSQTVSALGIPAVNYAPNNIMFYDPNECFSGSSSSTPSGNSAKINGYASKEKVWSGLLSLNYSPEIVAGIMGNMQVESDFNPARYEQKYKDNWESGFDWETDQASGHGVGLIQWSGSRRVNLFSYLRSENSNLTDKYLKKPNTYGGLSGEDFLSQAESESDANALISLEINFLDSELTKTSDYKGIFDQKDVESATKFFAEHVEGCSACQDGSDTMNKRIAAANEIYSAFYGKTYEGGESAAITGDYSNILAAKNANETVSGVDTNSEWYAGWSDTDTDSLKRVLEHYGDLAYQTGRALNVPWQAILVQMRYENPRAMCGSKSTPNNFWGMGCTGGSKASETNNLGKGFQKYAEFVTNEYQKHAIGIQDPYEYLVELGPSWVQGCTRTATGWVNSSDPDAGCDGYSEINNIKKSLEVLENFINTSEGQAIVQTFGNYTGVTASSSSSSGEDCCDPSSTSLSQSGSYKGQGYPLSDEDLKTLARIALHENSSSLTATKTSLSQMANLYDRQSGYSDILDYVINGKWYQTANENCSGRTCSYGDNVSDELFAAAKDIIVNGNRTIPLQVVQHYSFGSAFSMITNNGVQGNADDRSEYKSGETIVYEGFSTSATNWVFWNWADPEAKTGDPFGYEANDAPPNSATQPIKGSTTTTSAGSNVTWTDDGWISGGIEKYYKDSLDDLPQQSTWGYDFLTDSLSSKHQGKGPNKILLHVTEGGSDGGNSVHNIYAGQLSANGGKTVPPNFTVDIKNKIIYQHQSIWKSSAAIISDSEGNGDLTAGIQIEIVGFDYGGTGGEWDLTDEQAFGDDSWNFLAEFLNGISVETGIPLTSSVDWKDDESVRMTDVGKFKDYQGILSHKHAPLNDHSDVSEAVWKRIQSALSSYSGAQQDVCAGSSGLSSTGDVRALQEAVLKFAWPDYYSSGDKSETDQMPEYKKAIDSGQFPYYGDCHGSDCGGFVTVLMRYSGWDSNYNSENGNTIAQMSYLKANWTDVTSSVHSNNDAQPGDVLISSGHTLVYVGDIPGFNSKMASASQCSRPPMADRADDVSSYLSQGYLIFRKK